MKRLLIAFLLFVSSFSFAQNKILNVSLFKNNGSYVAKMDSADYFRFVSAPDSGSDLYNVQEVYKNGKRKLIGKSTKVVSPAYEGQRITYYQNGLKQSVDNFKKGGLVGLQYEFYPNGKPYQVTEYPDNDDHRNDIESDYLIKANYDSLGVAQVENGTGYYKGFDGDFKRVEDEGPVKNGKRDSLWKGTFDKGKGSFVESYKDGLLISGTATSEDGKVTTYTKNRGVPPQYKGGLTAFYQYLGNNIQYPDDARQNDVQGTVVINFMVEKDGRVTNAEIKKGVSPTIDTEALRVINNSPRWVPGMQFGRAVRVQYSIPVSFALSN